jgi:hypothetical protein
VYVHIEQQDETVEAMKQVVEANLQNPVFKKAPSPSAREATWWWGISRTGVTPVEWDTQNALVLC